MTIERRFAPTEFEVRQHATGGAVIQGHAAVFNRLSRNLGGFVEQIDPAAFDKTLADNPDVRALINHDPSHLLGRTRSGTLRLSKDTTGLAYEVDVPDRSDAAICWFRWSGATSHSRRSRSSWSTTTGRRPSATFRCGPSRLRRFTTATFRR